ncbi:MAG: DNA polymerase III subunit chi [Thalassotalea sp.]
MQTQVMFYLLPDNSAQSETNEHNHLFQACMHASLCYRNNQRVYIHTNDQTSAHHIDELLWGFEPDSFVPHNLVGEGPKQGAPVEIGYQQPNSRRPFLINLADQMPKFANQYSHIIDFVPAEKTLKHQARERFKQYRQAGFHIETQALQTPNSSSQP